uniref:Uncharacterized protein n=1 Tax=Rangifer tarandus platyrhynchus TaxID=3082113 RepID=A0ACB0DX07_RANTA|nr:unnamed protein product [Rangifer tarandus platyrhynchus]
MEHRAALPLLCGSLPLAVYITLAIPSAWAQIIGLGDGGHVLGRSNHEHFYTMENYTDQIHGYIPSFHICLSNEEDL